MTTKDEHIKHPKLARASRGHYHSCEWGIYGTSCSKIETFITEIYSRMKEFKLVYVDADHKVETLETKIQIGEKIFSQDSKAKWNEYLDKVNFIDSDAVFVNGNHYPASRQIVFIDPDKKDSLKRREEQLTNIDLVVVQKGKDEIFDFVKAKMDENTKVFLVDEMDKIVDHFKSEIQCAIPKLKAFVLAGGKSKRMGSDKSLISYKEDVSQQKYVADLCASFGLETFISKGSAYSREVADGYPVIKDRLIEMGPFGAILSAFMTDPNAAWLVLACDLPFLEKENIEHLISNRNTSKVATAFQGANKEFPEPLITIYEPRAYSKFLDFLSLGYSCPRKVLINSDVEKLIIEDERVIANANTPEERDLAKKKMKSAV